MQAPVELHSKIVEFFTSIPNIHDSDSRRAFVYSVSLDPQLQDLIDFAGPSAQFLQLLVSTLVKYGNLEDGRDALEAVLEAAKKYVGPDKQEYCEVLIQNWRSCRISYASQQNVSPERSSLTTTDREKAKTDSGPRAGDMAQEQLEEKMECFSWLHLTDLHRGMKEQHWLWPGVREIFFEDLERLHEKCGPWDLVLFTGDLTQRGNMEEFQKVDEILEQLWTYFKKLGSSPKLLAVPGNHDLVRPRRTDPSVRLLQQWADQPDIQDEFWEEADSPYRQVIKRAFKNYTIWWRNAQSFKAKDVNTGILPGDFSTTFEKEGAKLGIVGLNTSFLQLTDDNYEGKLALYAKQFQEVCGNDGPAWTKQHHACLLLTHHPPVWLNSDSQQHLNGEITARGRFAVHFCGHMHETVYREITEGGAEARRLWQGHSLFGLENFGEEDEGQRLHGYTGGKIELRGDTGTLLFWPREARLQGGQRSIVPDYSLALTDNQHTNPKNIELLQPYTMKIEAQDLPKTGDLKQVPEAAKKAPSDTVLPKQEHSHSIGEGLIALIELMQSPEARDSVIAFQTNFQAASEQIDILVNNKRLHDLLHTMQFQFYNYLVQQTRRSLSDDTDWDILMDYEIDFQSIIDELQDIGGRGTFVVEEVAWIQDIMSAREELHEAVKNSDMKRLKKAAWLIDRVLAIQPSRINTRLSTGARALRLPDLVNAMTVVRSKITRLDLDPRKVCQFEVGIDALDKLNHSLNALIKEHDKWQTVDNELRLIDANLEQNMSELELSWPHLKVNIESLYGGSTDAWVLSLKAEGEKLESAIAQEPVKVKQYFRHYRRRASDRFYQVDLELRKLCNDLRKVGEPLASVLRMIGG